MEASEVITIVWLSLTVSTAAVAFMAMPAIACGWVFARCRFRSKAFWEAVAMAPASMPPVALGLILLTLLDAKGPLGPLIRYAFPQGLLLTRHAATIAAAVVGFPYLSRASQQAFQAIPPDLEEASRTFGASSYQTFRYITLPLASQGLAHGALLAFARGLGEFGATVIVAGIIPGETETLSLAIFGKVMAGDDASAWIFCALTLLLTFGALILSSRLENKNHQKSTKP